MALSFDKPVPFSLEVLIEMIFDAYLNQNTESTDDVLAWWRNHGKGFSKLQPMAQDVLSIQASSVASKDVFSAAKFQIGYHSIHY